MQSLAQHLCSALPVGCRVAVQPLVGPPPGDLLEALDALPDPAMLESSAVEDPYGRYTILACRPIDALSIREAVLRDAAGSVLAEGHEAIWSALSAALRPIAPPAPAGAPPYLPGWIGYVGYEVGRLIERLPGRARRDTPLDDLRLAFHDAALVHDAADGRWWLTELKFSPAPVGAGESAAMLRDLLSRGRRERPAAGEEHPHPAARPSAQAAPNFRPDDYRAAVARCIEYIAAGDIFQVNLSQRFEVSAPAPLAVYRALRRRNPAAYAAYLRWDQPRGPVAVCSSSPELFLRVRGRDVITRPIKGTRPRYGDEAADAEAAAELLASPKDNAELAMIIDLLRNDIGRVCRFGSIRVSEPRRLEVHPTVFHLVGTVVGRLRDDVGPAELLRATLPGGSITGAPKIRAMEIIDELEPVARGVYTGCIGIVSADGTTEWNIAIRTVVWDRGRALVQVGGGIVADSDPQLEYEETLHKARALLEALAAAGSA